MTFRFSTQEISDRVDLNFTRANFMKNIDRCLWTAAAMAVLAQLLVPHPLESQTSHLEEFEPRFLSAQVSPEVIDTDAEIRIRAQWERSGVPILSSRVRFKKRDSALSINERWVTHELLKESTSPEHDAFEDTLTLAGQVGTYDYEVQALWSVEEQEFETSWYSAGSFVVLAESTQSVPRCVGAPDVPRVVHNSDLVLQINGPTSVAEFSSVKLELDGPLNSDADVSWCVDRGSLRELLFGEGEWSVELDAASYIASRPTIKMEVFVAQDGNYGWATKTISVSKASADEQNPPPTVEVFTPAIALAGEYSGIRFELLDFDSAGKETTRDLVSRFYLSIEEGTSPELLMPEVLGTGDGPGNWAVNRSRQDSGYRRVGSISWIPAEECLQCRILVESTDGMNTTTATSAVFSVRNTRLEFKAEGFVQDRNEKGVENVTFELLDQNAEVLSDGQGYFSIEAPGAGSFTLSASRPGWIIIPSTLIIQLSQEEPVNRDLIFYAILESEFVDIDIKPGSDENPINYSSNGKTPVAILSSASFNAPAEVDRLTLRFGRTGTEESLHYRGNGEPNCSEDEDHNSDGLLDLHCLFETPIAGFQPGDTEGILTGSTLEGEGFEGRDSIRIVGPHIFSSQFESGDLGDWTVVQD